jgi:hypothetical protein
MPETVKGTFEDGTVVLTVSYGPGQMLYREPASQVRKQLIAEYDRMVERNSEARDCIVVMKAQSAGSPFVRGLFELWEHVRPREGRVVCANYPKDYIDSLLTLGLSKLDGFLLSNTKDDAFRKLKRSAAKKLEK